MREALSETLQRGFGGAVHDAAQHSFVLVGIRGPVQSRRPNWMLTMAPDRFGIISLRTSLDIMNGP